VTSLRVGNRVFGFTGNRFGAHAEYLVFPEHGSIATMPTDLSYAQTAPATEGAHYALSHIRQAKIRSGQDALVYSATGAIGSAAFSCSRSLASE
jgi:NADPH:quinone reductase-like Zn-dependent oxidoreductase